MAPGLRAQAATQINLTAILESPQPVIDLRIPEYEASTRKFLSAVSAYTSRGIEEITTRKNQHEQEMKKLEEKKRQAEIETTACKMKEIKLMEVLEQERAERKDAESSVSELKRQFNSLKEKCASVDVEIEQYRRDIAALRREKEKEKAILAGHAAKMSPELQACEQWLRCVVEGVDKDKLLVRFTHIDESAPDRDFCIVIDVSSRTYKVPMSTPPLPTLPILVDELNRTRDVYLFIKTVRRAFQELAQHV
ncbi:hypothetical protein BD410DRAFT_770657 [Rickenella mellea]|uniref:Kinetochore protein SPC25 n=1 Tax=Rickenella mellea TaxID=50990 RepID=A0A4Y7Q492_9AGAM|nr:hypothetical protein BD410DRAFT_770657 [Rickenella mellea]